MMMTVNSWSLIHDHFNIGCVVLGTLCFIARELSKNIWECAANLRSIA